MRSPNIPNRLVCIDPRIPNLSYRPSLGSFHPFFRTSHFTLHQATTNASTTHTTTPTPPPPDSPRVAHRLTFSCYSSSTTNRHTPSNYDFSLLFLPLLVCSHQLSLAAVNSHFTTPDYSSLRGDRTVVFTEFSHLQLKRLTTTDQLSRLFYTTFAFSSLYSIPRRSIESTSIFCDYNSYIIPPSKNDRSPPPSSICHRTDRSIRHHSAK